MKKLLLITALVMSVVLMGSLAFDAPRKAMTSRCVKAMASLLRFKTSSRI